MARATNSLPVPLSPVMSAVESGTGKERSEEHTSELQSQSNLVCRLLLEKKKKNRGIRVTITQLSSYIESLALAVDIAQQTHSTITADLAKLRRQLFDETRAKTLSVTLSD